jgi:hypothetical protein
MRFGLGSVISESAAVRAYRAVKRRSDIMIYRHTKLIHKEKNNLSASDPVAHNEQFFAIDRVDLVVIDRKGKGLILRLAEHYRTRDVNTYGRKTVKSFGLVFEKKVRNRHKGKLGGDPVNRKDIRFFTHFAQYQRKRNRRADSVAVGRRMRVNEVAVAPLKERGGLLYGYKFHSVIPQCL